MRERAADLIGAALLVAVGAAFAAGSMSWYEVMREGGRIGPGFMPFLAGLLLALFGAMIGVEAWLRGPRDGSRRHQPVEKGSAYTVGIVFVLTLVAIALIPLAGFLVSFGLLISVLVTFVEGRGLLLGVVTGAAAAGVTWLVFVSLLGIPLPGGIFVAGG